jgi:hypothetical protein
VSTRLEKQAWANPCCSAFEQIALLARAELPPSHVHCFNTPWEETMRWKISPHGHDPRQIDLLAVIALIIVIIAAWRYFEDRPEPPNTTAFIVPSQSTHW